MTTMCLDRWSSILLCICNFMPCYSFINSFFMNSRSLTKSTSIPHKMLGHTNEFLIGNHKNLGIMDAQPLMLRCVIHMTWLLNISRDQQLLTHYLFHFLSYIYFAYSMMMHNKNFIWFAACSYAPWYIYTVWWGRLLIKTLGF